MTVIEEIDAERRRQIEVEGWSEEHDDQHGNFEMAHAAACYVSHVAHCRGHWADADVPPRNWPWDEKWWKPKSERRDLIRAAALLVAEIERLDRQSP